MIKNKIRTYREKLGYTQAELADKTNLSIRTIQRVESGATIPKGHTLKVLSEVLGIEKEELLKEPNSEIPKSDNNLKVKLINLSALFFIGIPFGNIFIPFMIWNKNKENEIVDEAGRRIINFQIIWSVITCLLLTISPFLQDILLLNFSIMLMVGILAVGLNLYIIGKTAMALNAAQYDILPLKLRLL